MSSPPSAGSASYHPPWGLPPSCYGGIWPQYRIAPHPPPPPWHVALGTSPEGAERSHESGGEGKGTPAPASIFCFHNEHVRPCGPLLCQNCDPNSGCWRPHHGSASEGKPLLSFGSLWAFFFQLFVNVNLFFTFFFFLGHVSMKSSWPENTVIEGT